MSREKIEKLSEKYVAGDSSLSEEQFLCDNAQSVESPLKPWLTFVNQNRSRASFGFREDIWQTIQEKRSKKRRMVVGVFAAAASILLLLGIFVFHPIQQEVRQNKKEQLLTEALNMFEAPNETASNESGRETAKEAALIYEDEMIIIYTASE